MEGDSFGVTSAKSKKKGGKRKKMKKKSRLDEDEKDKINKPKEIFEIAGSEKEKSPTIASKVGRRGKKTKLTGKALAQAQMSHLLVPKKTSILHGANRQKVELAVRSILNDVINQAVSYGESLKLTKKVQRRYAERPITKDVFVLINENYLDVVDVIPSSLSVYRLIGRILWLTYRGILKQYDIVNGKLLPDIGLVTRIPGKKTKIIDFMVDENSGNLYVLKENWDLELWDIYQQKKSPRNKIRLIQNPTEGTPIDSVFKNRHMGVFPRYFSLSENGEYLIVNTTSKNSTVMFIDP